MEVKYGASVGGLEIKRGATTDEMVISGYGSTFGHVDSYGHTIAKGAYADAIRDAKYEGRYPAMLLQHGGMLQGAVDATPVGIWTELREDDYGLHLTGKLAPTGMGRTLWALLNMTPHPAITGLSIGFVTKDSDTRNLPEGARLRLTKIKLYEVSLVTFPADDYSRVRQIGQPKSKLDESFEGLMASLDRLRSAVPAQHVTDAQATDFIRDIRKLGDIFRVSPR